MNAYVKFSWYLDSLGMIFKCHGFISNYYNALKVIIKIIEVNLKHTHKNIVFSIKEKKLKKFID